MQPSCHDISTVLLKSTKIVDSGSLVATKLYGYFRKAGILHESRTGCAKAVLPCGGHHILLDSWHASVTVMHLVQRGSLLWKI